MACVTVSHYHQGHGEPLRTREIDQSRDGDLFVIAARLRSCQHSRCKNWTHRTDLLCTNQGASIPEVLIPVCTAARYLAITRISQRDTILFIGGYAATTISPAILASCSHCGSRLNLDKTASHPSRHTLQMMSSSSSLLKSVDNAGSALASSKDACNVPHDIERSSPGSDSARCGSVRSVSWMWKSGSLGMLLDDCS